MNTPWWLRPCKSPDRDAQKAAAERQQQLSYDVAQLRITKAVCPSC